MGELDSFQLYKEAKKNIFLTLRTNTISFSKAAIEAMNYAEYVHLLVNRKDGAVAIQACNPDADALHFFTQPKEGKQALVRWADKKLVNMFSEVGGIVIPEKGVRIPGKYLADDNAILFDLKNRTDV